MMTRWKVTATTAALLAATAAVWGCAQQAAPTNLHESMSKVVAIQAQIVWDIGNRATDDQGRPDPTRLSDKDWQAYASATQRLADEAGTYSLKHKIAVSPNGAKLQSEGGEGAATAAQVQALIDGDREGFAKHGAQLESVAKLAALAARNKDAKTVVDVGGRLDMICEDCHIKYWYPQEAAARSTAQ